MPLFDLFSDEVLKLNMHIEIQVALNFLISYLYNKLPRRRVNIFAEELEKALKEKFIGHWYPEKPFKVIMNNRIYPCLYYLKSNIALNEFNSEDIDHLLLIF